VGIANSQQLSSQLAGIFTDAGLRARLYPDANNMKWSKMLTNLLGNATSAILGMTPREIFSDPQLYHLEITQLRETLQVMDALRIRVVNLPGTPTKILAWAVRRLPEMLSRPLLTRAIGSGRGGKMPSFYLDLQFGTGRSEVDYLNGAVVRAGKKTGTQTPVSLFLNETLLAMVAGSLPILEFDHQPGKLLARYTQQYD
jgi:2-dehydropantoate 2-reductase